MGVARAPLNSFTLWHLSSLFILGTSGQKLCRLSFASGEVLRSGSRKLAAVAGLVSLVDLAACMGKSCCCQRARNNGTVRGYYKTSIVAVTVAQSQPTIREQRWLLLCKAKAMAQVRSTLANVDL